MKLNFVTIDEAEKKKVTNTKREPRGTYDGLVAAFMESGEDIVKLTGYSATECIPVYHSLIGVANKKMKGSGFKVSKRGQNLYLLNTNVNRNIEPPERR